jgi:alanyl-tRNA synthetase
MGPAASSAGHTDCKFGCECGRYVEIWNLVFMQFNRDAAGVLTPLPKPAIDTGAGLERMAAVLQGKVSNFDTDLFSPLTQRAGELTNTVYGSNPRTDPSLRILADHARATTFLITDGVMPSNEGRGYVLRKIMRRAMRHAYLLGAKQPVVLTEMVIAVRKLMEEPYPELFGPTAAHVLPVVRAEEERFGHTLRVSLEMLEEELRPLTAYVNTPFHNDAVYSGEKAFRLYDTFGLPLDFIVDAARDLGIKFDQYGFEQAMEEQRTRAKASWRGAAKEVAKPAYTRIASTFQTEPDFYFGTRARDCRIEAIVKAGASVSKVAAGEEAEIVLDRTVIYAESGGQLADTGALYDASESMELAEVRGAYYPVPGLIAHRILAKEELEVGDRVSVIADATRRERNKRNHTATHLMHAALRGILGTHVKQAGSMVAPDRLRFDFSHYAAVDSAELADIEQLVNEQVRLNAEVMTEVAALDDALASGALAFFGDKYPEHNVRVVTIPDPASPRGFYSKELCGGTHVRRCGDIGVFKIAVEQSVAAGVRRIEALTGDAALADYQRARQILAGAAERLHVGDDDVLAALEKLAQAQKQIEKQLEAAKRNTAVAKLDTLMEEVRPVKDVKLLAAQLDGVDRASLRELVNPLRQKMGPGIVVLGIVEDGRVALLASVTPDLTKRIQAGKIIQAVATQLDGQGGGRPDLAEGGGKDTSKLKTVLASVYGLVEAML